MQLFLFNQHIFLVDTQVVEISEGKKWEKQTLIRSTINSGYTYITQFENNPGNFVSFFFNLKIPAKIAVIFLIFLIPLFFSHIL